MQSNLAKYRSALKALIEKGDVLHMVMQYECFPGEFEKEWKTQNRSKSFADFKAEVVPFSQDYQSWYSESHAVIKQLLPDRLNDFIKFYEKPKGRKFAAWGTYVIEDYLQRLIVTRGLPKVKVLGMDAAIPQFRQQLSILRSVERRFESSLFEIKQLVQADFFDSELDASGELLKNKFLRAAGAVAGVVLEKHLGQACENHGVKVTKKNPSIGDLNDLLKGAGVIGVPQWRFVQHLADIRNLCDHEKKKEPTEGDVADLISGVEKVTKTIF